MFSFFLTFYFVSFCFRAGINYFYVSHENGELYACSKGRPTKALAKKRLECPEQIEEELAGLRKDFLLNDKCKMLVLVSMATDEMICLVSMYPEVSCLWIQLQVSAFLFVFSYSPMNSYK